VYRKRKKNEAGKLGPREAWSGSGFRTSGKANGKKLSGCGPLYQEIPFFSIS